MTRSAFGTITRIDSERIRVRWEEPSTDGTRRQRSKTIRGTMDDAVTYLAARKVECGGLTDFDPLPLSAFWAAEYEPSISRRLRPSTLRGYRADWRTVVMPMFGSMDMRSVTSRWIERRLWEIEAPGTQRNAYKLLRQMFGKAYDWELIYRNPMARRMDLRRVERSEPDVYRPDEVRAVLDSWRGAWWEAAAICSLCGGLRREEACALRWDDFELQGDSMVLHVRRAITDSDVGAAVGPTKTAMSRRAVVISGYPALRLSELMRDGPLCPGDHDGYAHPQIVAKHHREWMRRRSDARYVPWMNLRHTYATILRGAGADAADVALSLGHTDVSTAYRHYCASTMDAAVRAAETYAASCRIGAEDGVPSSPM